MKTLATNRDNDIFTVNGQLAMAEGTHCQAVVLESVVQTQRGELQYDEGVGVDYFGTVFVNHSYLPLWAAEVKRAVEDVDWVKNVKDFEYRLNRDEDSIEWSMTVLNRDEEEIVIGSGKDPSHGSFISIDPNYSRIRNAPIGIEEVMKALERVGAAAGEKPMLDSRSTVKDIKDTINDVAIRPLADEE